MTKTRIDYTLYCGSKNDANKPMLSIYTLVYDTNTYTPLYANHQLIDAKMSGCKKLWHMWRDFVSDGIGQKTYIRDDNNNYNIIEVVKKW